MTAEQYATWEEAFDACREANRPLVVRVDGEIAKIFPSGSCRTISVPQTACPGGGFPRMRS